MAEKQADRILAYLRERQDAMVDSLRRLAVAESPSDVKESQQDVLRQLSDALEELDMRVRHFPGQETAGYLYARPGRRMRGQGFQLLIGHCDTVWPQGTLQNMPVRVEDQILKGPGVYDMKCGLVQILFALRALRDLDLATGLTPVVLINTDEEIGSHESLGAIRRLARRASRAFVLEPSLGPSGKLKTARKGVGRFAVVIKGKAAHAGLDPEAGASAIVELSHVIQKLFALNDPEHGTTVNVGVIDGGLRPNVIAPESRAEVDVRVLLPEEAQRVEAAILQLAPTTPRTQIEVSGGIGRPPLEPTPRNQALWRVAEDLGKDLGMDLAQGTAGGGSDGNYTSLYTPTLDGLGAVGDGAHADHEHVQIDKMPERCALLALLLCSPPAGS